MWRSAWWRFVLAGLGCGGIGARAAAAPQSASVYGKPEGFGEGEQAVELLRFVTAYRTGLEAMVDATPYAPLLSMADLAGNVGFYAFIDTWVGNATGHDAMYMNNVTHQCSPTRHTYGNGWALSLDLVVWPQEPAAIDTQPRSSITLASGVFGSKYPIGVVKVHEGTLAGNGADVVLDRDADFSEAADTLPVYACAGGAAGLRRAGLLGFVAQEALQRSRKKTSRHGDDADGKEKDEDKDKDKSYAETLLEYVASPELVQLEVVKVFAENRTVCATYSPGAATVEPGMPLYFASADVYIDTHLTRWSRWKNLTYPFEPVGHVVEVGSQGTLTGQLRHPCLPTVGVGALPRLMVPKTRSVIPTATALLRRAEEYGVAQVHGLSLGASPLLLEPQRSAIKGAHGFSQVPDLSTPVLLGHAKVPPTASPVLASNGSSSNYEHAKSPESASQHASGGTRACVVEHKRHGHLLARSFDIPQLASGERVLMQMAITGHGWAETTDQCGEYCHAVYVVAINGRGAANVTQFRDDCRANPINGSLQHGTWEHGRNGWCPGSVEPGLYVDVTQWLKEGPNGISISLLVWSNATGSYRPYTDYGGFAMDDQASLTVGLSLFVYDAAVSAAIRGQTRAFTAAERALRSGSSDPGALRPAWDRPRGSLVKFDQRSPEDKGHTAEGDSLPGDSGTQDPGDQAVLAEDPEASFLQLGRSVHHTQGSPFDFEARAPWYLYNESSEGSGGAVRVPIFSGSLVQLETRTVRAEAKLRGLPKVWGRAALHLRLTRPPGLELDHWDRQASVGVVLGGSTAVQLHPPAAARALKRLGLQAAQV